MFHPLSNSPLHSFLDDVEIMLKWRPPVVYKYLWKYVCLFAMVGLLFASLLHMVLKRPTYTAWNQETVRQQHMFTICYSCIFSNCK